MRRREQTVTGRWPACASYKEKSRRPEREGWGRAPGSGQDTDLQPDGRGGGAGIPRGPGRGRGQGSVQAGPCESFWGAGSTGGSVGLVGDVSWGRMSDCPCEGSLGTGWRRRHSQERTAGGSRAELPGLGEPALGARPGGTGPVRVGRVPGTSGGVSGGVRPESGVGAPRDRSGCLPERVEEEPGLVLGRPTLTVGVGRRRGAMETRGRSGGRQGIRRRPL